MFGLSAEKLLLLALLAVLIIGPERLPYYAKQLGEWVKKGKRMIDNAQAQMKDELGEGFEDVDWKKLDQDSMTQEESFVTRLGKKSASQMPQRPSIVPSRHRNRLSWGRPHRSI